MIVSIIFYEHTPGKGSRLIGNDTYIRQGDMLHRFTTAKVGGDLSKIAPQSPGFRHGVKAREGGD